MVVVTLENRESRGVGDQSPHQQLLRWGSGDAQQELKLQIFFYYIYSLSLHKGKGTRCTHRGGHLQ